MSLLMERGWYIIMRLPDHMVGGSVASMSSKRPHVEDIIERKLMPSVVVGLFPLGRRPEEYRVTPASLYAAAVSLAFLGYAGYLLVRTRTNNILSWLDDFMIAIYCAMFGSAFILPIVKRREFNRAVTAVGRVHEALRNTHYRTSSSHHLTFVIALCVTIRLATSLESSKFAKLAFFWISVYASLLVADQFVLFNGIMASQFRALKKELGRAATTRQKRIDFDTICSCYHEVVWAATNVNKVYSFQILCIFGNIFFKGTSELYLALDVHFNNSAVYWKEYLIVVVKVCWFLVCLGQSMYITTACEITAMELDNDKFHVSRNLLLITLAVMSGTFVVDVYFVNNTNLSMVIELSRYLSPFQHIFIDSANLSMLFFFTKVRVLNKCLRNVLLVDHFLKQIGRGRRPCRSIHTGYTALLLTMIVVSFLIRTLFEMSATYPFRLLAIYWPSVLIAILLQFVVGVVSLLRSGFATLLEPLTDPLPLEPRRLEQLAKAHHVLCRAGHHLNEIFGVNFLTIAGGGFAFFVCELYSLYTIFLSEIWFWFFIVKLCWCLTGFIIFWQLSSECENASRKAKEFNTLLYQLMIDDKTNEILNNPKLRLHITMKREVVFTACGFFNLDYTLVHSMIASATTYLVILIQFGQQPIQPGQPILSDMSNITGTAYPPLALSTTT